MGSRSGLNGEEEMVELGRRDRLHREGGGRVLDKKKKRGGWIMRGLTLVIVVEVWG